MTSTIRAGREDEALAGGNDRRGHGETPVARGAGVVEADAVEAEVGESASACAVNEPTHLREVVGEVEAQLVVGGIEVGVVRVPQDDERKDVDDERGARSGAGNVQAQSEIRDDGVHSLPGERGVVLEGLRRERGAGGAGRVVGTDQAPTGKAVGIVARAGVVDEVAVGGGAGGSGVAEPVGEVALQPAAGGVGGHGEAGGGEVVEAGANAGAQCVAIGGGGLDERELVEGNDGAEHGGVDGPAGLNGIHSFDTDPLGADKAVATEVGVGVVCPRVDEVDAGLHALVADPVGEAAGEVAGGIVGQAGDGDRAQRFAFHRDGRPGDGGVGRAVADEPDDDVA